MEHQTDDDIATLPVTVRVTLFEAAAADQVRAVTPDMFDSLQISKT